MLYRIDFYVPDRRAMETVHRLESDSPFMSIRRGDLINPVTWGSTANKSSFEDKFKARCVSSIEHFFIHAGDSLIHCESRQDRFPY